MQLIVLFVFLVLFSAYLLFSNYQYNKKVKINQHTGDGVNTCIFCGSDKLSKEHVFPEWIKNVIPANKSKSGFESMSYDINRKGQESIKSSSITYKHSVGSRKLRIVCHDCNNRWMSTLQNNNKAILSSLIKNENITLNSKGQQGLAAWCTMMTMVAERVYEPPYVVTPEDRAAFYKKQKPLNRWHIWIAKNSSKKRLNIMRLPIYFNFVGETLSGRPIEMIDSGAQPNTLILSYAIENFIFYALYDIRNEPIRLNKMYDNKLILIHPQAHKNANFSNLTPINDNDMKNLNAFFWSLA